MFLKDKKGWYVLFVIFIFIVFGLPAIAVFIQKIAGGN